MELAGTLEAGRTNSPLFSYLVGLALRNGLGEREGLGVKY